MAVNFQSNGMISFDDYFARVSIADLPNSPMDMDADLEDLESLCQLVRNHYLNRLRQTLLDNVDKCGKLHDSCIVQYVDICMAEMEKRALRRCMVASIYRQDMAIMIDKVKTSTQNSMLYDLLQNIIKSEDQILLWENKFTKNVTKQSINVGINTEQESNKTTSTQTENLIDSDNNIPDNLFATNAPTVNGIKSISPVSLPVVQLNGIEPEMIFENLNLNLNSMLSSNSPLHSPKEINIDFTENTNLQQSLEPNNCAKNDLISINALLRDLQDSPELYSIDAELGSKNQNSMDVSELPEPIFIDSNTLRQEKIYDVYKNKLKCERIAKEYELLRSMNNLPQKLRTRLENKFIDLFGRGHNYDNDPLSEEEQRFVAHKRIVKLVVQFMTPYYNEQRISRSMFKSLAKIISLTFMDRSYDPDEESVRKGVSEFFTENRCIKRYEDIYYN